MNQVVPVSIDRPSVLSRVLFWVGLLVIPTILIIQVLVYKPFFGIMDDGLWLTIAESGTFLQNIRDFALFAPRGLSRAFSMLVSLPTYWAGAVGGATVFHIANILTVFLTITLFLIGFCLLVRSQLFVFTSGFLGIFLWPFSYELVLFPSLNEKGVILSVGLIMITLSSAKKFPQQWMLIAAMVGAYLLAVNSKTQVIIFMPALLVAGFLLYTSQRLSASMALLNSSFVITTVATQIYFDLRPGTYGAAQQAGTFRDNASSMYAVLILGIVVTYAVYLAIRFWRGNRNYMELVPLVMMATFWASIVYFGYRNYFLSIFGVMMGSAVAVVVGNMKSIRLEQLATGGLILMAVGWTLFRIPQVFEPLHGIGAFTQGQIARELAEEGAVIYTSCVEGSGHFNYYTERKWGITPEFAPLTGEAAGYRFGIPDEGQYVFGDRRLCAAPGEVAEWDVVWASPGDDGFRLYKRPTS